MRLDRKRIIPLISVVTAIWFLIYMANNVFCHLVTSRERLYFIIIICGVLCAIGFYSLLVMEKIHLKYEYIFAITVLLWGIVFQLVFPFSNGSDESKHFSTAYYNANVVLNMDLSKGISGGRVEDVWVDYGNNGNIYDIFRPWYLAITEGNWLGQKEVGNADIGLPNMFWVWWKYIPSTIGIIIGRILNLGHFGLLYFARYFNTLYVAIIGALAIRISPRGKAQLAYIGMIPLFIGVSASYNYDAVFLPLMMLYISIIVKIYDDDILRFKDVIIAAFCYVLFTMHKSYLAFYIFLLIYVMWKKRRKNFISINKKKLLLPLMLAICIGGVGMNYVVKILKTVIQFENTSTFTIGYMLTHIQQTVSVVYHTIVDRGWWILRQVFLGQELIGFHFWSIGDTLIIAFIVVLIVFLYKSKCSDSMRGIRFVGWMITIASLGAIMLGALIRFIPIDYVDSGRTITGRYILPLFLLLIPLYNGKKDEKRDYMVYYLQNILLITMICKVLNEIFTYRSYVLYLGS